MPRACFIVNPVGGSAPALSELMRNLPSLLGPDWDVRVLATGGPGDATAMAARAVEEGFDVVVAAGGDGTVNEVLQPLVGSRAALAVLPLGTGNVWAHEVGIPLDLIGALRVIAEGRVRKVDVGTAGDRFFLLMAGIGYDATVLGGTNSRAKRALGIFAYVVRGVTVALAYRGRRMAVEIDGVRRSFRAFLVVVGNSRRYGGPVEVTAEAKLDDGLLDVCVFRGVNLFHAAWFVIQVILGRHLKDPAVSYFRAPSVSVDADPAQPVQVDGDLIGCTPFAFGVRRRALRVVVPSTVPAHVFSADNEEEYLG